MVFVIVVLIIICGVLGYNLYTTSRDLEKVKLEKLKFHKFFTEEKCKEYVGYDSYYDEVPYGVNEYDIKPYFEIDGVQYDITDTEYFNNKVELLETKKHLKALLVSSEIQSCFLRELTSSFEDEDNAKFKKVWKKIAKNLEVSEDDARKLYHEIMKIHPFYYDYSTSSEYAEQKKIDGLTKEDVETINAEIINSEKSDIDVALKKVYSEFLEYLPHYRNCSYETLCNVDINLLKECHALRKKFDLNYELDEADDSYSLFPSKESRLKTMKTFNWDSMLNSVAEALGGPYPELIARDIRNTKHKYINDTLNVYPEKWWGDEFFSDGATARAIIKLLGPNRKLVVNHIKNKEE